MTNCMMQARMREIAAGPDKLAAQRAKDSLKQLEKLKGGYKVKQAAKLGTGGLAAGLAGGIAVNEM